MITWWQFALRLFLTILLAVNVAFVMNHIHSPLVITHEVAFTDATANQVARELLIPKQYACLKYVMTVESHENPLAKSPTSSARGIGQLLASTYRNLGIKHSSDQKAQLVAMLAYISERYGSGGPCAAKANELKHNFY
jgi:hypothetical protein